jgi:hypothetical protein
MRFPSPDLGVPAGLSSPRSVSRPMQLAAAAIVIFASLSSSFGWNSALVRVDSVGRLSYVAANTNGDRIADFSNAGYRGGGIATPTVPVVKTLDPVTSSDDTARIQAALDAVGALPLQADGYRGALRLNAGVYFVTGTLRITKSGVVLAGVGNGDDATTNTILRRTGTSQAPIIQAGNTDDQFKNELPNTRSQITTAKVQVGSRSFDVDHPEYYKVGDVVIVWQPSTQAWINAVDRGGVTDTNYWKPGDIEIRYHRYVTAISGNTLTVDAPVFNHLDRSLSQSYVYKYNGSHVLTRLGIEKLEVDIVTNGELTEDHAEDAIKFVGAEESWIRDSTMKHFWHAGVQFEGSTRCSAERCRALEPHGPITGGYRYNFSTYHAQLILFQDCFASYARHAFVCNGTSLDSGIVFLNGTIDHAYTSSEGHRRWSTGLLYDNIVSTNRQSTDVLGLYNRGTYGTGHGWASAHSVAWNCNADGGRIWIQQPPTAQNYGIGCSGNVTGSGPFAGPTGYIESTGQTGLVPKSLYLAQLAQRLADVVPVPAPTITTQPSSQTVVAGGTATFTVSASGSGLSYQWTLNGASISSATNATLALATITAPQAGNYAVIVANAGGSVTSSAATLTVTSAVIAPAITKQPISQSIVAGSSVTFALEATGTAPTYQWRFNSSPITGATSATLTLTNVSTSQAGSYTVTLANSAGSMTSNPAALTVTSPNVPPTFTKQPTSQTISTGESIVLSAGATSTGSGLAYQWKLNGVAIPNATDATLTIASASSGQAGSYSVTASDSVGATTSDAALINVVATNLPGRLVNLSIRARAGSGDQTLIVGAAIGGNTGRVGVLLRAAGPSLAVFGLTDFLADPVLTLFSGSTTLATNNDWNGDSQLSAAAAQVGAFPFSSMKDAASFQSGLAPGGYSMQVTGGGTTGTALAELYDGTPGATLTADTARLVNVSARTQVGTGADILICGFTIGGTTSKTLLIRAIGPSLAPFGVTGVLADPKLELFHDGALIDGNDNWGGTTALSNTFSSVGAFALSGESKDAALVVTLPPGSYTAQVSGVGSTTGVALVEVYDAH